MSNADESSLLDEETLKKLKLANSFNQILEGIQYGIGFLWGDVETGSIQNPSDTTYYFSSIKERHEEDYQVYIMFYIKRDFIFAM